MASWVIDTRVTGGLPPPLARIRAHQSCHIGSIVSRRGAVHKGEAAVRGNVGKGVYIAKVFTCEWHLGIRTDLWHVIKSLARR